MVDDEFSRPFGMDWQFMSGFVFTYLSGQLSSPEAHADADVEAV